MKKLFLMFVMLNLFQKVSFAQNQKIDSLLIVLKTAKEDTNKVNHLNKLSEEYRKIGKYNAAIHFGNNALKIATIITNKEKNPFIKKIAMKGIADAYNNNGTIYIEQGEYSKALISYSKALKIFEKLGVKKQIAAVSGNIGLVYYNKGDFTKALDFYSKVLKMQEDLGNKNGMAIQLGNIGVIYDEQGNYPKALESYFKALKIDEELSDKNGIAIDLVNIGIIYKNQKDYSKALEYYIKALKIDEELGDKMGMAIDMGNIGNIYYEQKDYPKALEYISNALKIFEELGSKSGMAFQLGNLASIYSEQGEYSQALEYSFKALRMNDELGNQSGIVTNLTNIGSLYTIQKRHNEAEKHLIKALLVSRKIGALDKARKVEECLSRLYFEKKEYKKAYEHYHQYSIAKDSLFNIEKHEDITRKEMNFEFERKEQATKLEQEKKTLLYQAELEQQKTQRNAFIGGFGLMLALASVSYRNYRNKRKAHGVIAHQKELVEEKQKEILDSINYAKRIQAAVLPPSRIVKEYLPDSFILYKPKDIVAGDFYWMERKEDAILFAAADCTGHGVPGAMVSVICNNALNRSIREYGLTNPGDILDKTRDIVIQEFEKSDEEVRDGMDISLCSISGDQIKWAGANNPLWILRNNEIIEYKPDKQPIGKYVENKPFTTHSLQLNKGEIIYLFTDGYADQFGGEKGKKFKYAKLKELLISTRDKNMTEQKEILNETFEAWKGNLEQVDDVCVIGVRV